MVQAFVQIREIRAPDSQRWKVQLCHGSREWDCELTDPSLLSEDVSRESLQWVFEHFPRHVPYETSKAQSIFEQVVQYAVNLEQQLLLLENLASLHEAHPPAAPAMVHADEPTVALLDSIGLLQLDETPNSPEVSTMISSGPEATRQSTDLGRPAEPEPAVVVLDVQASDAGSVFHGLLWESLECLGLFSAEDAPRINYRVRRVHMPKSLQSPIQEALIRTGVDSGRSPGKTTFNILFAVSRPQKDEDIDPHLASGAVVDILMQLPAELVAKVQIEVARPGTWDAFQRHITSKTIEWHQAGGTGPWFDAVHFDVHGVMDGGRPFLKFLSKSGTKEFRQSAERVGELLRDSEINLVLMNSCESAKVTGQEGSNLARVLLDYGVETVVAMQFPLTSTGALTFIKHFYTQFLREGADILEAVALARHAMIASPSRAANLGLLVTLPDFVIPVVYHNPRRTSHGRPVLSSLAPPPLVNILTAKRCIEMRQEHESLGCFVGRNYDILKLEWMLLRRKGSNVVLINGMRGSGKTMLALWLTAWWSVTGLCVACYRWSYRPGWSEPGFVSWLRMLYDDSRPGAAQERAELFEQLRSMRVVFLIDGLDCAFSPLGQAADSITVDDKVHLKDFIGQLEGGKTLLILTSISPEPWLELPAKCLYTLSGLSLFHAHRLARLTLADLGHESLLEDPEKLKYIEYILYRLHFNPCAIVAVMRGMIAVDGPNPKAAFDALLLAWIRPDYSLPMVKDCVEFIHRVYAKCDPSDHARTLLLLGFAAPTNTYSLSFYEFLAESVNAFTETEEALTADAVAQFVEENFIGTGWIERLSTDGVPLETREEYFLVHPMLTNTIRMVLDAGQYRPDILPTSMSMAMFGRFQGFIFQRFYRSIVVTATAELKNRHSLEMRVNSFNYFSALNSLATNIQLYVSTPDLLKVASVTALPMSLHFWRQVVDTNAIHLPLDILLSHAQLALMLGEMLAETDPETYGALFVMYCELCMCLYRYNIVKRSLAALPYVQKALRAISQILRAPELINEDFGNEFFSLSSLAGFYVRRDFVFRMSRAKAAAVTSLLLCRAYQPERELSTAYRYHFTRVCHLLYQASVAKEEGESVSSMFLAVRDRAALESSFNWKALEASEENPGGNALPAHAVAWNADSSEGRMESVSLALKRASVLQEAGSLELAKGVLVKVLRHAILTGNKAAEFSCQSSLATLYSRLDDWETAEKHALRAMELAPTEESTEARYLILSMHQTRLMYLRFAIIFIRLGRWDMAMCAFQGATERGDFPMQGGRAPEFSSAFEGPEDFISKVPRIIRFGLLLLSSAPSYLMSGREAVELGPVASQWFTSTIRDTWPDFDVNTASPDSLELGLTFPGEYKLESHPASFELDVMLRACQDPVALDDETIKKFNRAAQASIDSITGIYVAGRQELPDEDPSAPEQIPEISKRVDELASQPVRESLSVEDVIRLAEKSFVEDAAEVELDVPPVVTWDRVRQVVADWVQDHSPPNRGAIQSKSILRLLERMHDDGSSVPDPPARTFSDVIELLLRDIDPDDDEDELDEILGMLVPTL